MKKIGLDKGLKIFEIIWPDACIQQQKSLLRSISEKGHREVSPEVQIWQKSQGQ